jgi:hypothetical protein
MNQGNTNIIYEPAVTLDKMLEELKERRIEDFEQNMFGYDDDVGYYDWIQLPRLVN